MVFITADGCLIMPAATASGTITRNTPGSTDIPSITPDPDAQPA